MNLLSKWSPKQEGYYILIKRTNYPEDIAILNIYTPNIGALSSIKQIADVTKVGQKTTIEEKLQHSTLIFK